MLCCTEIKARTLSLYGNIIFLLLVRGELELFYNGTYSVAMDISMGDKLIKGIVKKMKTEKRGRANTIIEF